MGMSSKITQRSDKLLMRKKIADRLSFKAIPFYSELTQGSHRVLKGMDGVWCGIASQKVLPKDVGAARLARFCVALYVKHATGATCYPEVCRLLESVGLATFGEYKTQQLSRDVKEYETSFDWTCDWLK